MARSKRLSSIFWLFKLPLVLFGVVLVGCNLWVVVSTRERVFESAEDIPERPVGLVLGTSKNVAPDTPNRHFDNRLDAAAELFHAGKVDRLLVSGHRDSQYYDEPRDMVAGLKELGVPEEDILTDDRGARTFDSVARARSEFGFERIVIVSDDFHVGRALFIADRLGIEAVALRSEPVDFGDSSRVRLREYFARVKAVIDLALHSPEGAPQEMADREP